MRVRLELQKFRLRRGNLSVRSPSSEGSPRILSLEFLASLAAFSIFGASLVQFLCILAQLLTGMVS